MKYFIKGNGEVSLTKSNFLASGGEGQIYAIDDIAYKIYIDPSKMIPIGKINELAAITNPNVINPKNIILDKNKSPVGYSMRFIKDNYALCQLFTRAFRERERVTHEVILNLIKNFRAMVAHIHSKNILVVDLNELNFLVNKSFDEIYAIDTGTYKTPSYPATALMESVRDRHSKDFSENTDWFSFGILSFQMIVGIHPYKGNAPIKGLDERMKQNISVFNKNVSIPKVCYPIDSIPEVYRNWYKAIFDDGKRIPPPVDFQAIAYVISSIKKIIGNNSFDIEELNEVDGDIIDIFMQGAISAIYSSKKLYLNKKEFPVGPGIKICVPPQSDTVFLAKIELGLLKVFNTSSGQEVNTQISASSMFSYYGQLYIKNEDKILEIDIIETSNKSLISGRVVANVLEKASILYNGVVIQNLLGTYYFSMFPKPKIHRQIRIKEIENYKIIDAKFDRNVLMVLATKNGKYDKFILRFNESYDSYDMKIVNDIVPSGLNFATLDSGTCIHITEEEKLNIFLNKKDHAMVTEIDDDIISGDMKLFSNGSRLLFSQSNKLYSMKMKKKS